MIEQQFCESVFFSTQGAGFSRKALWRCRTGPHALFDLIGSAAVIYSSGGQKWLVIRGYVATELLRDEVIARHESYADAAQAAQFLVNLIYRQHLAKEVSRETFPA